MPENKETKYGMKKEEAEDHQIIKMIEKADIS